MLKVDVQEELLRKEGNERVSKADEGVKMKIAEQIKRSVEGKEGGDDRIKRKREDDENRKETERKRMERKGMDRN